MMLQIADRQLDVEDAAKWLAHSYLPETVRYYDYAGVDRLDDARSPTDRVELNDLGRLVCIGGSLTYERGHTLLQDSGDARWPDAELSDLRDRDEVDSAFYEHPDIETIVALFEFWTARDGLGYGTIGKLLHIKWPSVVPVTDRAVRDTYRRRAVQEHNTSELIREKTNARRRRRSSANIRAYLKVFRDDLRASAEPLAALRDALSLLADPEGGAAADGHVSRVRGLTDVRLLDALAWGLTASERLRAKSEPRN